MSDFHLTDEQAEELKSMGPLGEEPAYALWLWRECPAAPWDGISLAAIFRTESDKNEPTSAFDAVEATICYARNTAELRAALAYWGLKYNIARDMANRKKQSEHGQYAEERNQAWTQYQAIAKELKEMRP